MHTASKQRSRDGRAATRYACLTPDTRKPPLHHSGAARHNTTEEAILTAQSDRNDLETVRAFAGSTIGPEQDLGRTLAANLADELPDIDHETRARVALHIGKQIAQASGRSGDRSGVIWGNAVLIAAVNQEES